VDWNRCVDSEFFLTGEFDVFMAVTFLILACLALHWVTKRKNVCLSGFCDVKMFRGIPLRGWFPEILVLTQVAWGAEAVEITIFAISDVFSVPCTRL